MLAFSAEQKKLQDEISKAVRDQLSYLHPSQGDVGNKLGTKPSQIQAAVPENV
jgi:hypothetical protein